MGPLLFHGSFSFLLSAFALLKFPLFLYFPTRVLAFLLLLLTREK